MEQKIRREQEFGENKNEKHIKRERGRQSICCAVHMCGQSTTTEIRFDAMQSNAMQWNGFRLQ